VHSRRGDELSRGADLANTVNRPALAEAEQAYREAIKMAADGTWKGGMCSVEQAHVHAQLATVLGMSRRNEACLEEARTACALDPGNVFAQRLVVVSLMYLGRSDEALQARASLLAQYPALLLPSEAEILARGGVGVGE